jgi:transposase
LRHLYKVGQLATRQLGARFGISKTTVKRWLVAAGIPLRPKSKGLEHRGITPPTSEELHRLVHVEHLSYREIATRYGVEYTAVPHWLKKHGIPLPTVWDTRRKGRTVTLPTPETARMLYESGLSLETIGDRYGVSAAPIKRLCLAAGTTFRADGWNGGLRHRGADGHALRSTYEQRVCDWLTNHGVPHTCEPPLPDPVYRGDFLANGWYIEIWGVKNSPSYRERMAKKKALYEAAGLPLIELSPHHFSARRAHVLERRLRQTLTVSRTELPLTGTRPSCLH